MRISIHNRNGDFLVAPVLRNDFVAFFGKSRFFLLEMARPNLTDDDEVMNDRRKDGLSMGIRASI